MSISIHPYNKNSDIYNLFFHPLHLKKQGSRALSVITNIFITLVTAGLWQVVYWTVNQLDNKKLEVWKKGQADNVHTSTLSSTNAKAEVVKSAVFGSSVSRNTSNGAISGERIALANDGSSTNELLQATEFLTEELNTDAQNLLKIQEILNSNNIINISATPPLAKRQEINLSIKQDFLNHFNDENTKLIMQEVIEKHIFHITMDMFRQSLQKCVEKVNQFFAERSDISNYSIGYAQNCSQTWVASLALPYLSKLPTNEFDIALKTKHENDYWKESHEIFNRKNHALIIFDDCMYSGTQTRKIVNHIYDTFRDNPNSYNKDNKFDIIVVTPYTTKFAERKIQCSMNVNSNSLKSMGFDVSFHLINENFIPSLSEINMGKDTLTKFCELYDIDKEKQNILTLVYCDWKKPDHYSVPTPFFFGLIPEIYYKDIGDNKWRFPFVPRIQPPYKIKPEI